MRLVSLSAVSAGNGDVGGSVDDDGGDGVSDTGVEHVQCHGFDPVDSKGSLLIVVVKLLGRHLAIRFLLGDVRVIVGLCNDSGCSVVGNIGLYTILNEDVRIMLPSYCKGKVQE